MAMSLNFSIGSPQVGRVIEAVDAKFGRKGGESNQAMMERCIIHRVCHLVQQHEQREAAGEVELEMDIVEVE